MFDSTTLIGRFLRLPLRLLPKDKVIPVLSGPLRGMRWVVGSSNHGCWLGMYERKETQFFISVVQHNAVVWDIGANVGYYTLMASRLASKVFAFEPLPSNVAKLKHHLELNHLRNVFVEDAAISDHEGDAFFKEEGSNSMGRIQADGQFKVRLLTMDGLWQRSEIAIPSLIKLDVEGAELSALRGGVNMLKSVRPAILLATHSRDLHRSCSDLLLDLRYQLNVIEFYSSLQCGVLMAHPK